MESSKENKGWWTSRGEEWNPLFPFYVKNNPGGGTTKYTLSTMVI